MEQNDMVKKVIAVLAATHFLEALIARRMAKKRGKKPGRYFVLGLMFGFFTLLKLRKIEKVTEAETEA